MKKLLGLLLFALIAYPGFAFVIYDTTITDNNAITTATLGLDSNSPVNYWDLTFLLPENTEINSMRDTQGTITQYTQNGKNLKIRTNSGPSRTKEVITLSLITRNVIDSTYNPLKIAKLSYSGFEGESTSVTVKTNEKIITSNIPFGFSIDKKDSSLTVSGQGPTNLIITMSNGRTQTKNYVVFGRGDVSDAIELNQIVPRIIGIIPYYNQFPLIVLPGSQYTEQLDGHSAGTYKTGGLILMPEAKEGKAETASIILHETTHAYNDQILRWSQAKVGWFDEGTATYVGWIANQIKNVKQPEIFGDDTIYYDGFIKYTLPSQGNREDLWNYYQQGRTDIKYWNSHSDQSSDSRHFGYAFSQLMIRDYVNKNGPESLHTLYQNLNKVDHRVESDDEYNQIILTAMGSDMRPCYSTNRVQFDKCLDDINDMKAIVPQTQLVKENYGTQLDTETLLNQTYTEIEQERNEFSIQKILFKISEVIDRFVRWITSLFK